jgi:AcrR family transcriptional regulator
MDDIAKEAGIGRTGLYRLGLNRSQLTEAAIMARFTEIGDSLRSLMERDLPFAQLLVDGSVATIDRARNDPELRHLLSTTKAVELTRLLVGPNPIMHDLALGVLRPAFRRARANGEMREDVSDDRATDWIRGIYLMFILREDLTPEAERDLIADFLLPSLTAVGTRRPHKDEARRARSASRR